MPNTPTVPMYAPDGTLGDVPYDQMHSALQAGGKMGVNFLAPDGTHGIVPADRTQEAQKAGGKIIPYDLSDADGAKPGFWSAFKGDLKGMVEGLKSQQHITPTEAVLGPIAQVGKAIPAAAKEFQVARQRGHDVPYSAAAAASTAVGANPEAMEQSAEQGDTGGVLGHAAALLAPIAAGTALGAAGSLIRKAVPESVSESMYQSALKPSTTIPQARVDTIVKTGLRNAIPVSEGGLEKLGSLIDDLNDKIKTTIDSGSKQGATVNKYKVASRLGDTAQTFKTQVNPSADLNAISSSGNEFLENQPTQIPASDAQALKQGTYKQLKSRSYGELRNAEVESQKALARGIKEELVQRFPEIGGLNAEESRLINLDGVLERAVNRIGNHQLIGIGTPIAAGAAKAVTGSTGVGAAVGVLKGVIDNPYVKSRLAIALSKKGVSPMAANMRIASYSAALDAGANAAQNENPPAQSTN